MKKDHIIYWTSTGIVCAVMVFSIINFNLAHPVGPPEGSFAHLRLPDYFRIELTLAKTLGVLALLWPGGPTKGREFAYFGFGLTLVSAAIAHFSSGDPAMFVLDPLIFLGLLIVSARYARRVRDVPGERAGKLPRDGKPKRGFGKSGEVARRSPVMGTETSSERSEARSTGPESAGEPHS